jgi:hypothetical protein
LKPDSNMLLTGTWIKIHIDSWRLDH